jgi:hypothetical protein
MSADLTKNPDTCSTCYAKSEMTSDLHSQIFDFYYPGKSISSANDANPFVLQNDQCDLNCDPGTWLNRFGPTQYDQACTSYNCKNWDLGNYWDEVSTPYRCNECWTADDVSNHRTWPAKGNYKYHGLLYRRWNEPFVMNIKDNTCELQCDNQSFITMNSPNDQKCSPWFCKSF